MNRMAKAAVAVGVLGCVGGELYTAVNGSARSNRFFVGHQQHYEREMQPDFRMHEDVFFAVGSITSWTGICTAPGSR